MTADLSLKDSVEEFLAAHPPGAVTTETERIAFLRLVSMRDWPGSAIREASEVSMPIRHSNPRSTGPSLRPAPLTIAPKAT